MRRGTRHDRIEESTFIHSYTAAQRSLIRYPYDFVVITNSCDDQGVGSSTTLDVVKATQLLEGV